MPVEIPRVHSLVFNEVLVAYDAVETASKRGDATGFSLDETLAGLISGEITGEALDDPLVVPVPFPLVNLAPCFVTAATTPPPSLPFFRSFLETGMNGDPEVKRAVIPLA